MNGLWKKSLALVVVLAAIGAMFIVGSALADNTIAVNQVSAITNQSIGSTTVAAAAVGQSQAVSAPAAPAGYQLSGAASQQITVTGTNDQVTFYYTQTSYGSITVNYQDQSGKIVATTYANNLPYGAQTVSPAASAVPSGYTLATSAAPQTVTISQASLNATVTFPVINNTSYPVTVKYMATGVTTPIATDTVYVYPNQDNYIYPKDSTSLPALAGYKVTNLTPVKMTLGSADPTPIADITITVSPVSGNQLVNFFYLDLSTNQAIRAAQVSQPPLSAATLSVSNYQSPTVTFNNVTYNYDHMVKDGNTVAGSTITLSGAAGMQNVYLYYSSLQVVEIKLLNSDGTQFGSVQQMYPQGSAALITAPVVSGYTLSGNDIPVKSVAPVGLTGASGNTVTFTYDSAVASLLKVTVNYEDPIDSGATLPDSVTLNADNGLVLGANDIGAILTGLGKLNVPGYVLQTQNLVVYLTPDAPTATLTLTYTKDRAQITYNIYAKNTAGSTKLLTPTPVPATVDWNGTTPVSIPLSMDATGYPTITGAPAATSAALTVTGTSGAGTSSPAVTVTFDPNNQARSYTLDIYYNQPELKVTKTLLAQTANGIALGPIGTPVTLTDFFYGTNNVPLLDSTMTALPAGYTFTASGTNTDPQQVIFNPADSTTYTQAVDFVLTQAALSIDVQVNKYTDGSSTATIASTEDQMFTNQYRGTNLNYGGNYPVAASDYATMPYVAGSTLSTDRTIDLTGYVLKTGSTASYTFSPVAGQTATYTMTAPFAYMPDTKVTVQINQLKADGSPDTTLVYDDITYVNVPFGNFTMTAAQVTDLLAAHGKTAPAGYKLVLPTAPVALSTTQTIGTYTVNYVVPSLQLIVDHEQTNTTPGTLNANMATVGSTVDYTQVTTNTLSYNTPYTVGPDQNILGSPGGYKFNHMEVSYDGGTTWTALTVGANNQAQITFTPAAAAADQTIVVRVYYDPVPTGVQVTVIYPNTPGVYTSTDIANDYTQLGSTTITTVAGSANPPLMTWTNYSITGQQAFLDQVQAQLASAGINFGPYITWPGQSFTDPNGAPATAPGTLSDAWALANSGTAWTIATDGYNINDANGIYGGHSYGDPQIYLVVNNPTAAYMMEFYRQYDLVVGYDPVTNIGVPVPGVTQNVMVYPYYNSSVTPNAPVYVYQDGSTPDRFPANNEWTLTSGGNTYALYVPDSNQVVTSAGAYGDSFLTFSTNIADYTTYSSGASVTPTGPTGVTVAPPGSSMAFKITDTLTYVPLTQYTVTYVDQNNQPVLTQQLLYFDPANAPANVNVLGNSNFTDAAGTLANIPATLTANGYVSQVYVGATATPVTGNINNYLRSIPNSAGTTGYMLADNQSALIPALTQNGNMTVNLVPYEPKIYINVWDKTTGQLVGTTSTAAISSANNTALPIPDYLGTYTYAGTSTAPTAGVKTDGTNPMPADMTVQYASGGYQLVNAQSPGSPIASADIDRYIDLYYVPNSGGMTLSVYSVESNTSTPVLQMGPLYPGLMYGQQESQFVDLRTIPTPGFVDNYALATVMITKADGSFKYYDYAVPTFAADLAADGYSLTETAGGYTFTVNSATDADYGMQVSLNFVRQTNSNVVIHCQYWDTAAGDWITGYFDANTLAAIALPVQSIGDTVDLTNFAPATVDMLVNGTLISFTRIDDASSQDPAINSTYPSYTVTAASGTVNVRYQPTTPGTIHVKLVDFKTGIPIPIYPLNKLDADGYNATITGIVGSASSFGNVVNLGNLPLPDGLTGTFQTELTKQGFVIMGSPSQTVYLPTSGGATEATVTFKALQSYGGTIKVNYQDVTLAPDTVTNIGTDNLYQLAFTDDYRLAVPLQYQTADGELLALDESSISVTTANGPVSVTTATYLSDELLYFDLHRVPNDPSNNLYTVNVGYKQYACTVTVDVRDQANNPLINPPFNIPSVYGLFTLNVVQDILSAFPGYELAPGQAKLVEVTLSSSNTNQWIPVQLVEKLCSIEVIYLDATDNSIIKREVIPAGYNHDYVLTPATLTGYQLAAGQPNAVTVNFAPTDDVLKRIRTVTFAYTPDPALSQTQGVNVVFKDAATGATVYSDFITAAKNSGTTVKSADYLNLPDLASYTLQAGQKATQTIVITEATPVKTCTFMVERRTAPVTIQYVLVDSADNQLQVLGTDSATCPVGTDTTLSAVPYPGYLPVVQDITITPTLADQAGMTVTFKYTLAPISVSAQAIITDNGVAGSPIDISDKVNIPANPQSGVTYNIQAPALQTWPGAGYELTSLAVVAVTPDVANYQPVATFEYTKLYYSATVQGVDDDNNGSVLYTDNYSLPYGLQTPFNAPDASDPRVQGYTLVGGATQNVDVTQNGTTVTFHYTENAHGYTVVYVDTTNGGNTELLRNTVTVGTNNVVFSAYNAPITVPTVSIYTDTATNTTYRLVSQSATSVTPTPAAPYPVVTCSYQQFTGININAAFIDVNTQQWVVVPQDTWDLTSNSTGDVISYTATDHAFFNPVRYNGNLYYVYQPVRFIVQITPDQGPMYFDDYGVLQPIPSDGLTFNCNWLSVDPMRSAPALLPLSASLTDEQPAVGPAGADSAAASPDSGDQSPVSSDTGAGSDSSAVSSDSGASSAVSTDSGASSAAGADSGSGSAGSSDAGSSAGGSDSGAAAAGGDSGSSAGGSDSGSGSAGAE